MQQSMQQSMQHCSHTPRLWFGICSVLFALQANTAQANETDTFVEEVLVETRNTTNYLTKPVILTSKSPVIMDLITKEVAKRPSLPVFVEPMQNKGNINTQIREMQGKHHVSCTLVVDYAPTTQTQPVHTTPIETTVADPVATNAVVETPATNPIPQDVSTESNPNSAPEASGTVVETVTESPDTSTVTEAPKQPENIPEESEKVDSSSSEKTVQPAESTKEDPATTPIETTTQDTTVSEATETTVATTAENTATTVPIPKKYTIEKHGSCEADPDIVLVFHEQDKKDWYVSTPDDKPISVHNFAYIAQNYPLQARLHQEEKIMLRDSKILSWTWKVLAVSAVLPLRNNDAGFSAREEARVWTSVFLLGSAFIVYKAQDIPKEKLAYEQSKLAHYYNRNQVLSILERRYPTPVETTPMETPSVEPEDDTDLDEPDDMNPIDSLEDFDTIDILDEPQSPSPTSK